MKNDVIISKMLGYVEKILKYSANMSYDDFVKSEMVVEACVFNLSQIGELANKLDTVILASCPIDILSDGETTVAIDNGDDMMPLITGSGCMLSSIVGSCIGGSNPFDGSLVAILAMNIAGEKARAKVEEKDEGTGSFRAYLIDYLYKTDSKTLVNEANIEIL